jgi:molybdopterin synthase catalytic subunit
MQDISINLVDTEISLLDATAAIASKDHGANTIFSGTVRQHNRGKEVIGIDYDVYLPLAKTLLEDIAKKAIKDFKHSVSIYIYHLYGKVKPGQSSMIVAVSTAHRVDAYRINRAIVEAIKHQVPIWKKEYYLDGSCAWLEGCQVNSNVHAHAE